VIFCSPQTGPAVGLYRLQVTALSCVSYFLHSFLNLSSCYLLIVGEEGYCSAWSHSVTITLIHTPHSVRLLWTKNVPVAESSTWQHRTLQRQTSIHRRNSNPQSHESNGRIH